MAVVRDEWGEPATKTRARAYAKRIRENLRDIEAALRADDWEAVHELANDTAGATAAIVAVAEANGAGA